MAIIDDLKALIPVAQLPNQQTPNPVQQQQGSWVQDLIDSHSQTQRLKRSPISFNFQPNPYDPSSYYKSLEISKNISTAATAVTAQEAANRSAAQAQSDYEASQAAVQGSMGGINAQYTYDNISAAGKASSIINSGMKQLGKPYVFGDEGPNTFDCSGLMQFIFKKNGINLPRTAAQQQKVAHRVSKPRPGDLVFYGYPAHHVALYLGNGKMLAAPHTGANVRVQPVYGKPTYGRI